MISNFQTKANEFWLNKNFYDVIIIGILLVITKRTKHFMWLRMSCIIRFFYQVHLCPLLTIGFEGREEKI